MITKLLQLAACSLWLAAISLPLQAQNEPYVIEYMVQQKKLTAANGNPFDYVVLQDDGRGPYIVKWMFPEPKLSVTQLDSVERTQGFIDFLANRDEILKKEAAQDIVDDQNITVDFDRAKKLVNLDLINELRNKIGFTPYTEEDIDTLISHKIHSF